MIEYGLLFGLGFLSAILVGLLVAPAIHKRIVKFTENRILATVPVSPQELRAQKDMVRAEMAVQVARTAHDLKLERHRAAEYSIARDEVASEAARLHGENADLQNELEEVHGQAREYLAQLHVEEAKVLALNEALMNARHGDKLKDVRIDELLQRNQRLTVDLDNLKADLAARDAETEGLRVRINGLRDERESLRNDLRQTLQRAKDAELKLAREENRANRLEERLASEAAAVADKDVMLERRQGELGQLRERLKNANAAIRENNRARKADEPARPLLIDKTPVASPEKQERAAPGPARRRNAEPSLLPPPATYSANTASSLLDGVRERARQFGDQLLEDSDARPDDDRLREEMADIAARMIAATVHSEGAASPILAMIENRSPSQRPGRKSLAQRSQELLARDTQTD